MKLMTNTQKNEFVIHPQLLRAICGVFVACLLINVSQMIILVPHKHSTILLGLARYLFIAPYFA